jgi:hypothetical protein
VSLEECKTDVIEKKREEAKKQNLAVRIEGWCRKWLGDRITDIVIRFVDYVLNKPNPLVQIFYFIVAGGGFAVYVKVAFFKYIPGPYLADWHKTTGSILMFACYFSYYKACSVDPGIIKHSK